VATPDPVPSRSVPRSGVAEEPPARAPVRRVEGSLEASGGLRLFRRAWLPPRVERTLVVVHGFAEHSGRYDPLGAWFASRGFAVHAYDQRGHGRSDGARCHVERFGQFLDDLDVVLACVRDEHPGAPLALLGHSMGGLVVAAHLAERDPALQAAVTSGAALALSPDLPRARVFAARALRRLAPRLRLGSGLDPQGLSRDAEVVRRYVEDPLIERSMTTSLATELLAAVERSAAACERVRVPWLLLHGEADPICPVEGSRAASARVRARGSALRTYPGLRHEILNEPEHLQVFEDVRAWLDALAEAGAA
jgi:alpha-beta hydrolase superfamily lysophospholipase